jgi:hypothetical protein
MHTTNGPKLGSEGQGEVGGGNYLILRELETLIVSFSCCLTKSTISLPIFAKSKRKTSCL